MTAMMFAGAPFNGEMTVVYNYVRSRYGWDAVEYSNYSTFKSVVSIIGERTLPLELSMKSITSSTSLFCLQRSSSSFLRSQN